ncbi:MAG: transposase [Sedimenticola sp.]
MKKRRYQSRKIQRIDWDKISEQVEGQRLIFAIDVAKEAFYGALMTSTQEVLGIVKWMHPSETRSLGRVLEHLPTSRIEAVMEPSGTYGDSLRHYLRGLGVEVYRISPKRVHDAAEVFDGVPSLHDAKAAYNIGRLHLEGISQLWQEHSEHRRDQHALIAELDLYRGEETANLNRLGAMISRHWPELEHISELNGSGVLHLITTYGSPQAVCNDREAAEVLLRHIRRGFGTDRIHAILDSAEDTLGIPCTEGECHLLQTLGNELLRTHKQLRQLGHQINSQVKNDAELQTIGSLVGNATSLVLESTLGSPLNYPNPHAYVKAMGLNLKEHSSGKHKGKLKITKRGPGKARYYLYFSAMRLTQSDPVVHAWYRKKVQRDGKLPRFNALVAVMRKVAMAVWHVARGESFDSSKLFNAKALGLA